MKLSQLIDRLNELYVEHGDLPVALTIADHYDGGGYMEDVDQIIVDYAPGDLDGMSWPLAVVMN